MGRKQEEPRPSGDWAFQRLRRIATLAAKTISEGEPLQGAHRKEVYAISSALKDAPAGTQQLQMARQATMLANAIADQLKTGTADPQGCTHATVLDSQYEQWRE